MEVKRPNAVGTGLQHEGEFIKIGHFVRFTAADDETVDYPPTLGSIGGCVTQNIGYFKRRLRGDDPGIQRQFGSIGWNRIFSGKIRAAIREDEVIIFCMNTISNHRRGFAKEPYPGKKPCGAVIQSEFVFDPLDLKGESFYFWNEQVNIRENGCFKDEADGD